jgi:hypothetical protein
MSVSAKLGLNRPVIQWMSVKPVSIKHWRKIMRPYVIAAVAFVALTSAAQANPPVFSAKCPTNITVDVDRHGTVRINGHKAKLRTQNSSYWEAKDRGVTISISKDASGLLVSYTAKGGANGMCQVLAQQGASSSSNSGVGSGVPSKDEQICLQAVTKETNNPDVVLLRTETSEANNAVIVGVGPQKAPWQCLIKDGVVAGIMSLTNEGAN